MCPDVVSLLLREILRLLIAKMAPELFRLESDVALSVMLNLLLLNVQPSKMLSNAPLLQLRACADMYALALLSA